MYYYISQLREDKKTCGRQKKRERERLLSASVILHSFQ